MTEQYRTLEGDDAEADGETRVVYRCECGHHAPTMTAFVDHVSIEHRAIDIAIEALLDAELTVGVTDDG